MRSIYLPDNPSYFEPSRVQFALDQLAETTFTEQANHIASIIRARCSKVCESPSNILTYIGTGLCEIAERCANSMDSQDIELYEAISDKNEESYRTLCFKKGPSNDRYSFYLAETRGIRIDWEGDCSYIDSKSGHAFEPLPLPRMITAEFTVDNFTNLDLDTPNIRFGVLGPMSCGLRVNFNRAVTSVFLESELSQAHSKECTANTPLTDQDAELIEKEFRIQSHWAKTVLGGI